MSMSYLEARVVERHDQDITLLKQQVEELQNRQQFDFEGKVKGEESPKGELADDDLEEKEEIALEMPAKKEVPIQRPKPAIIEKDEEADIEKEDFTMQYER